LKKLHKQFHHRPFCGEKIIGEKKVRHSKKQKDCEKIVEQKVEFVFLEGNFILYFCFSSMYFKLILTAVKLMTSLVTRNSAAK
jgi:hypothetical protein